MTTVVIDASAIAAILFGEPKAAAILDAIRGANLIAPRLLPLELASVGLKKVSNGELSRADVAAGLRRYAGFGVLLRDTPLLSVWRLADATGLTAYDASYLWLARELGVRLTTLDGDLAEAAAAP